MKQTPLKRIITIACGTVLFFLLGAFVSISSPIDTVNICVQYGLLGALSVVCGPLVGALAGLLGHILIDLMAGELCWSWIIATAAFGALVGGLYGDPMYTVWALCAIGSILLCLGWFGYLKLEGMEVFPFRAVSPRTRVPYILRRFKDQRPHRPAFRKDSRDFDDDLTAATAVDDTALPERAAQMAQIWAKAAAGVVLFLVSFLI